MRFAIPLIVLAGLLALFYIGLQHDPRELPSPLIGKPAPAFDLPQLALSADAPTSKRLTQADLVGTPHLVNFFASWCAGCQVEHPFLMQLASQQAVPIVGIDYKDAAEDAQQWLAGRGNPYTPVLADLEGQVGIDWGVYGVPETFVVDAKGVIAYKHIGALTPEAWAGEIKPRLDALKAAP
jgi:cytochrome c biogenesis protein CcmG/thiol:disulfide interchange protein DsbE